MLGSSKESRSMQSLELYNLLKWISTASESRVPTAHKMFSSFNMKYTWKQKKCRSFYFQAVCVAKHYTGERRRRQFEEWNMSRWNSQQQDTLSGIPINADALPGYGAIYPPFSCLCAPTVQLAGRQCQEASPANTKQINPLSSSHPSDN